MSFLDDDMEDSSEEDEAIVPKPAIEINFSERFLTAEARTQSNPWDIDAWTVMVIEAQTNVPAASQIYDKFTAQFPTAGRWWAAYAVHETEQKNWEQVQAIFAKALLSCAHLDLWKAYLQYIKASKVETADKVDADAMKEAKAAMVEAYEFALQHIGLDVNSMSIWDSYLEYLKETGATTEDPNALRKVYQRAVAIPMTNSEKLWRDYEAFENGLNEHLAKALLEEHHPIFQTARGVCRDRTQAADGLMPDLLAHPPGNTAREQQQVAIWKKMLAFEKTNPERLEQAGHKARVRHMYLKCLTCLRFYPEFWQSFAAYEIETADMAAAVVVYRDATKAYSFADFLEEQGQVEEAKQVYEQLLTVNESPLAFIQYQHFARRAETDGTAAARAVFKRARKSARCTAQVFVAAARLEAHANHAPQVARNVYELGMKRYQRDPAYVSEYIEFLRGTGDDTNLRALFERVLDVLPAAKARAIWDLFLDFETRKAMGGGSLSAVRRVETRRAAAYSAEMQGDEMLRAVHRYCFMDLAPGANEDGSFFQRHSAGIVASGVPASCLTASASATTTATATASANITAPAPAAATQRSDPAWRRQRGRGGALLSAPTAPSAAASGASSLPAFLQRLAAQLPPADRYTGPRPDPDRAMQTLREFNMPPGMEPPNTHTQRISKRKR